MIENESPDSTLPGDAWENEWHRQRAPVPQDLRRRVLEAVAAELAVPTPKRPQVSADGGRRHPWRKWAIASALSLLWLHTAWSAALDSPRLGRDHGSNDTSLQVEQLRELVPELSLAEARRIVVTQNAGAQIPAWKSPWRN